MTAVLPAPLDVTEDEPTPIAGDPRWVRPSAFAMLVLTGVLYLWNLGASGWANAFYSAAVQAGTHSWKAMFFGSFDSSNAITVDKPPASLWVMEISTRIFGINSWAVLIPQALEGVAAVGLLYLAVRRVASPAAGLLAGTVMALTPAAALMFRFNNPDALLVLLLVAAAYCTVRAVEAASTRWIALAGVAVGFGFITKMLQALVIVPVLAVAYLWAAPTGWGKRIRDLLIAGVALVVSAGWWVAIVELWPASSRPYIGGSQHNSVLELALGYNGLGRITGNETGSVGGGGGGGGGTGMWGATGLGRMFNSEFGDQISWLIPGALVLLVAGLWLTRRNPRTDPRRASLIVWGGWLVLTGVVFSEAKGIIHPYYSVALAPAIGALVGIMGVALWTGRKTLQARLFLAAGIGITTWWVQHLLGRSPDWQTWLKPTVVVVGVLSAVVIGLWGRAPLAVGTFGLLAVLAGPAAASIQTAADPHTGSIPSAGPSVQGGNGFGPGGGGRPGGFGGQRRQGQGLGGFPGFQGGQPPAFPGAGGGGFGGGPGGGGGGLLDAATPSADLTRALQADASSFRWVAATVGANSAAGYQLAADEPVMAIGGFNGSDPSPTLAQFEAYVAQGKIHYFIGGGGFGGQRGGSQDGSSIASWVESSFQTVTIGGTTVYDLTRPTTATGTTQG